MLEAAWLCTAAAAECIAKRRANIAKAIEGCRILEERRGAARRRGTPTCTYWREQELSFEEEGQEGREGLGFVMKNRGGNAWTVGGSRRSDAFGDYRVGSGDSRRRS